MTADNYKDLLIKVKSKIEDQKIFEREKKGIKNQATAIEIFLRWPIISVFADE